MSQFQILWADDEIDLLKPHILFLKAKGYEVTPVYSGNDAIELCMDPKFDILFLDENMPGLTGLETLVKVKTMRPALPVVMITKSDEERIMEEAIGSKIADYLIKPINPSQVILSLKKILENKRLVSEKTNQSYLQEFRALGMSYTERLSHEEWADVYKKLLYWEQEIELANNDTMKEVLDNQKQEANTYFWKFISNEYEEWLNNAKVNPPLMSHQLMKTKVFPLLKDDVPVFFILMDNLRFDQWKAIEPLIAEYFTVEEESTYFSILPTTTAYARNAIFAGMMPSEIEKQFPKDWVGDDEEDGKNNFEDKLVEAQLAKNRLDIKFSYHKILNIQQGKALTDNYQNLLSNKLNVIVYNFVDMLSHARTDMAMIKELAPNESGYRSLTKSWFTHSPLFDLIKSIATKKVKLIITTDHGTVLVKKPYKIVGDKESTNSNLRYKQGRNLNFEEKGVYFTRKPERLFLPKRNISTTYVFCPENYFFAYPNNYNYFVNFYKDTFQHGGISLEEMIIPYVVLTPKNK